MGQTEQKRSLLSQLIRSTILVLAYFVQKSLQLPARAIRWTWNVDTNAQHSMNSCHGGGCTSVTTTTTTAVTSASRQTKGRRTRRCNAGTTAAAGMGVVCGTHKHHRKFDLTSSGNKNGMIRHSPPCDCECALTQSTIVANGGTALTTSQHHDVTTQRPAGGVWSYTPWQNGYHEFKSDIAAKCSRFVHSYVFWRSTAAAAVTPENNNNNNHQHHNHSQSCK